MPKKKNLSEALKGEGRVVSKPASVKVARKEEASPVTEAFKNLIVKIPEPYHYSLKALALQKKTTVRVLCHEAITDLFRKHS